MNRYTEIFRRRATNQTTTEFIPVEVEPPKEKKPEEAQQVEADKMIVEEQPVSVQKDVLPNHELIIFRYDYTTTTSIEEQQVEIPKDFSSFLEGESSYEPQPTKLITYDNAKNQALKNRINALASGLKDTTKPTETMEVEPQPANIVPRLERE